MGEHIEQLESWFKSRSNWLQDATRRLLEKGDLDQVDLDELYKICGIEAGINFEDEIIPEFVPMQTGSFTMDEEGSKVELRSIGNIKGINALNPKRPVLFNEGLTVIYGQNGSGKSGYTRLLKQICGAKKIGSIYPDVFSTKPDCQVCDIGYTIEDELHNVSYDISLGINDHLSSIEIYDSDCGSVYVNEENELAYEPELLRVFSRLIEISDELSEKFKFALQGLVSTMPSIPQNYLETPSGKWLRTIKHDTASTITDETCQWNDEYKQSLEALVVRSNTPELATEATKLKKVKVKVDELIKSFRNWENKLGVDNCSAYLDKKKDSVTKAKAATKYAKSIFEQIPLTGVGEEIWSLMWKHARAYSKQVCYPETEFPNVTDGSVCVLCQQPLNEEAKQKLIQFESFVKGELELAAKKSTNELAVFESSLSDTPDEELISTIVVAANLDDVLTPLVMNLRMAIENAAGKLLKAEVDKEFESGIDFSIIPQLEKISIELEISVKQLEEDAKKDNRPSLVKQKVELEARKWLSEQKQSVLSEIELLKQREKINTAKTLVKTVELSRKKSNLAEELVTEEYISRFSKEVNGLGAERLNVKLEKTRTSKGRVYFQLKLTGSAEKVAVNDVLSEGEFRIISLAAFLADVRGRAEKSTFLFDDPISSLDQEYEEKVAARLVELSNTRQVIVFTHRLSLLASLEGEVKNQGVSHDVIGLYREHWGAGQPSSPPMFSQNTKNAINTLISKMSEGNRIYEKEGYEKYTWWAKTICCDARITIERVVEYDLLADVVQRFRRPINTKGKLMKIAKVSIDDCSFIDEMMTKFSKYEHAQPNEAPVSIPLPNELEKLLTSLKDWRKGFIDREI